MREFPRFCLATSFEVKPNFPHFPHFPCHRNRLIWELHRHCRLAFSGRARTRMWGDRTAPETSENAGNAL